MRYSEEMRPAALAMAGPVQWVASSGSSVAVRATTWSMTSWPSGSAKRSCQRQTQSSICAGSAHDLDRAEGAGRKQHDLGPPGMVF